MTRQSQAQAVLEDSAGTPQSQLGPTPFTVDTTGQPNCRRANLQRTTPRVSVLEAAYAWVPGYALAMNDPDRDVDLFKVLTASLFPVPGAIPLLQPVWATEAMHRALGTLSLTMRHDLDLRNSKPYRLCRTLEHALGGQIASLLATLTISAVSATLPCSETLCGIVSGLVGLFGSKEDFSITVHAVPLRLRSDRRRALILAAVELTTRMILAKARQASPVHGTLTLSALDLAETILTAECAGVAARDTFDADSIEVLDDMACVLDGELELLQSRPDRWRVRLRFPTDRL